MLKIKFVWSLAILAKCTVGFRILDSELNRLDEHNSSVGKKY